MYSDQTVRRLVALVSTPLRVVLGASRCCEDVNFRREGLGGARCGVNVT
jgi:hypothetical protein